MPIEEFAFCLHARRDVTGGHWYLAYSPWSFTSYINWLNTTSSEIFIHFGINRIFVSPSCRLQLREHTLISDFNIRLDTIIKHYQWDLEQVTFSPEVQARSADWLTNFENNHIGKFTLSSIHQFLAAERRSSKWIYIFTILGLLTITSIGIGYVVVTRHLVTLKQRILTLIILILPEPVLCLLQQPAAPAPGAPPQ